MHFFHVLTKMNYRHMQNALEGINMYIKKPVMYYPKQVRRFSFIQTHSNRTALRLPESLCTQILAWGTEHYLLQWHSEVMSVCSSHLTFTECTEIIPIKREWGIRRLGCCPCGIKLPPLPLPPHFTSVWSMV